MSATDFILTQDIAAHGGCPPAPCCGSLDLRLGDCMEGMKTFPDGHFDLAIVDPPYGIGMGGGADWGTNTRTKHEKKTWDTEPPPAEYFAELRRVSKHQIIWGGNYFLDHLTSTKCFLVWDKMNGGNNMADCELAWTSFDSPVRKHTRHIFSGIGNTNYTSIHPTQKPVGLYDWLFSKYAKAGMRVLDTHMGSGSIAIAAHYAGIHLTAYEIDADYYEAAKARIARETSQTDLFIHHNVKEHAPSPARASAENKSIA